MASITSANAVLLLSVPPLFSAPQQLQGFSTDDITDVDPIQAVEAMMGVDGVLSGGFVYAEIKQKITLQADSPSNQIFETWWKSQRMITDVYFATATLLLPSVNKKYAFNNGLLSIYPPVPSAKRVLQPRTYEITWESVTPSANASTWS